MSYRAEPTTLDRVWGVTKIVLVVVTVYLFALMMYHSIVDRHTLTDALVIGHDRTMSDGGTAYYTVVTDQGSCPADATAYFTMKDGQHYNIVCSVDNNRIDTYQEVLPQ